MGQGVSVCTTSACFFVQIQKEKKNIYKSVVQESDYSVLEYVLRIS